MKNWLKIIFSATSGFATAGSGAATAGADTKTTLIFGALGALTALGNLHATAPKDTAVVNAVKAGDIVPVTTQEERK